MRSSTISIKTSQIPKIKIKCRVIDHNNDYSIILKMICIGQANKFLHTFQEKPEITLALIV